MLLRLWINDFILGSIDTLYIEARLQPPFMEVSRGEVLPGFFCRGGLLLLAVKIVGSFGACESLFGAVPLSSLEL
jgi:hypothetical protein